MDLWRFFDEGKYRQRCDRAAYEVGRYSQLGVLIQDYAPIKDLCTGRTISPTAQAVLSTFLQLSAVTTTPDGHRECVVFSHLLPNQPMENGQEASVSGASHMHRIPAFIVKQYLRDGLRGQ